MTLVRSSCTEIHPHFSALEPTCTVHSGVLCEVNRSPSQAARPYCRAVASGPCGWMGVTFPRPHERVPQGRGRGPCSPSLVALTLHCWSHQPFPIWDGVGWRRSRALLLKVVHGQQRRITWVPVRTESRPRTHVLGQSLRFQGPWPGKPCSGAFCRGGTVPP